MEIENKIRPKEFMDLISPHLPEKYSPLQRNGNGIQSVYLVEINSEFAQLLINLTTSDLSLIQKEYLPILDLESDYEISMEIKARHIEGDLEQIQIVKSRRGQGIFKANVRLVEKWMSSYRCE